MEVLQFGVIYCSGRVFEGFFFGGGEGGQFPVFMLIGWCAANIICFWMKCSWADDMVQVAKNEMLASEECFACLLNLALWTVC